MALKVCKDCGAEISKSAETCPQCGKRQINAGQFIITFICFFCFICIVVGLATSSVTVPSVETTGATETTKTQERFTLQDGHKGYKDSFAYYIEGTVKNNTDRSFSYAQITFNLYDKDGAQVGTAMDNISNLDANGTWKIKAIGMADNIASYKLAEITGW